MSFNKRLILLAVAVVVLVLVCVDVLYIRWLATGHAHYLSGSLTVLLANVAFATLAARVAMASTISLSERGVERGTQECALPWSDVRQVRRRGYVLKLWGSTGKGVTIHLALFDDPKAALEYVDQHVRAALTSTRIPEAPSDHP